MIKASPQSGLPLSIWVSAQIHREQQLEEHLFRRAAFDEIKAPFPACKIQKAVAFAPLYLKLQLFHDRAQSQLPLQKIMSALRIVGLLKPVELTGLLVVLQENLPQQELVVCRQCREKALCLRLRVPGKICKQPALCRGQQATVRQESFMVLGDDTYHGGVQG